MPTPGRVIGGQRTQQFINQARAAQQAGVDTIEIGFYGTARYPPVRAGVRGGQRRSPVPVSNVALWNEFGTSNGIPERPFMRQAISDAEPLIPAILRNALSPYQMAINRQVAAEIGELVKSLIQRRITTLRSPANAPSTIERKGSSNPLFDEGFMRKSVTYKIDP